MKGQFFLLSDTVERKSFPYLTIALILINVIIFVWSLTSPIASIEVNGEKGDIPLYFLKYGFIPAQFSLITIFTSMFLHSGLDHLVGNMWYLWIFGDNVEDYWGKIKYIIIYFLSGIAATLLQWLTDPTSTIPSIGASGAISGVLGSYFILYPKAGVETYYGEIPAYIVIGFWFVLQLVFGAISLVGVNGSGIAFFAHVGGFVFGIVATWIYKKLS
jgi:membrane associated rhomboid family serine protease